MSLVFDDSFATLEEAILDSLETELEADEAFDEKILEQKIKSVVFEVKQIRGYDRVGYTDAMIDADIQQFAAQIRNIVLYDYNQVGVEGQQSSSENNTYRMYFDRSKLFAGICPLARVN